MPWTVLLLLAVLLVALTGFFIVNAQLIRRDMKRNKSIEKFRARLEDDANSVIDALLKSRDAEDRT